MRVRDPRLILLASAAILGAAIAFPLGVIASHQFTDVPSSSTFHDDIDAIADVGVTTGCAAGKYCPKDFVTREQMAAFLNRLGALGPGKVPVVNADKVDGRDASDFTYVIDNVQPNQVAIPAGVWTVVEQVTIVAPTDGFVLVNASATILNATCTQACLVDGAIERSDIALVNTASQHWVQPGLMTSMSLTRVFPVTAGSHTLQVRLHRAIASNGNVVQNFGQISAIFSPFGESHS
jgi:hypothetical protein